MRNRLLILVMLGLTAALLAAGENYLITVDSADIKGTDSFVELDLKVYQISGSALICGASNLPSLNSKNIPFNIIDEHAWSEKYYLISDKRGIAVKGDIPFGRELYRDERVVLVKTGDLSIEQIISLPYKITELFPIPLRFSPTKFYPPVRKELPALRTEIVQLLNEIDPDSLGYFIQSLEDFVTRYSFAPNRDEVAGWIENEFLRFGYTDVFIDSFIQEGIWHKNVVTTLPGSVNPGQIVIIGGHHDSILSNGDPMIMAPGADDNGSGTGTALEIARAMKAVDFQPEMTIRFITFAAEEIGLWGSHHYAETALNEGMDIILMLNNDMTGYTAQGPDEWTIHLREYTGAENETHFARQIIQQYTTLNTATYIYNPNTTDSYSFWLRGFPAISFIELEFNPFYHTTDDLLIHLNMDYAVETARASAAIAALIDKVPAVPEDFTVTDAGNGHELILDWSPVLLPETDYYEAYIGLESGDYFASFATEDTTYTLSGLEEGITYYIGVSAVGISGFSSLIAETTGVPGTIPLTPRDLLDYPHSDSINLNWTHNLEADLAGYNLYRSETEGLSGEQLNQEVIVANYYFDFTAEPEIVYYYSLTAVDETGNESEPTEQIYSRLTSMDQGVLIVADTAEGNGSFQNPALADVTQFYNEVLSDYSPVIYSLWSENRIKLADLGAYSTVIWHKNNVSTHQYGTDIIEAIRHYLDSGGKILFSVYHPSRLLGATDFYPQIYTEGDFLYDYLKVEMITLHQASRFVSAQPVLSGYPELTIDDEKAPSGLNYHIINIESVHSASSGTDIFTYHSGYPPDSNEASMQDLPVGIEYSGDDDKVILLSFPLFYIDQSDAEAFISYVMNEKFNEQVGIEEGDALPLSEKPYRLYTNYPNPFNPETVIRYSLEQKSEITLAVYNLKGQKIKVLISEKRVPGEYSVVWDGKDDSGKEASSGIYFYRLSTEFGQETKKMLLIK
jgi:hypothetical protein